MGTIGTDTSLPTRAEIRRLRPQLARGLAGRIAGTGRSGNLGSEVFAHLRQILGRESRGPLPLPVRETG